MKKGIFPGAGDAQQGDCITAKEKLADVLKVFGLAFRIRGAPAFALYETVLAKQNGVMKKVRRFFSRLAHKQSASHPKHSTVTPGESGLDFTEPLRRVKDDSKHAVPHKGADYRSLPIVFIHLGDSDYLQYSLAQAQRSNPSSTVYLLGDHANSRFGFVKHRPLIDYFSGALEFAKVYRHFSTNRRGYELFCFQRWFVLREFLAASGLSECLYIDSDVMLYVDVTEERRKFAQYDFTLATMLSGHTFFLNRVEALGDFCNFLLNMYTGRDRYHYDKMVAHYMIRRKNRLPGGVCDMTALQLYMLNNYEKVGEVVKVIDGSIYDVNIRLPTPGFEMNGKFKKITWIDGKPYGTLAGTGELVRFNSLHFQGGEAKKLMGQFFR